MSSGKSLPFCLSLNVIIQPRSWHPMTPEACTWVEGKCLFWRPCWVTARIIAMHFQAILSLYLHYIFHLNTAEPPPPPPPAIELLSWTAKLFVTIAWYELCVLNVAMVPRFYITNWFHVICFTLDYTKQVHVICANLGDIRQILTIYFSSEEYE